MNSISWIYKFNDVMTSSDEGLFIAAIVQGQERIGRAKKKKGKRFYLSIVLIVIIINGPG